MKAHGRARNKDRQGVPLAALVPAGVISATLCLIRFQTHPQHAGLVWMLVGMIVLAQLMPVDVTRGGIRVVFALPYVTALAVFSGPSAAIGADILGLLVGSILILFGLREREGRGRAIANLCI